MGFIRWLRSLLTVESPYTNESGGAAHPHYQARSKRCMVCGSKLTVTNPYHGGTHSRTQFAKGVSGLTHSGGKIWCQDHTIDSSNYCVHGFLLSNDCPDCPDNGRDHHLGDVTTYGSA